MMVKNSIAFVLTLLFSFSSVAWGQAVASRPYGGGSTLGQSLYWLTTPQIRKELEIVPEQQERLAQLQKDSQTKLSEAYKKLADVPQEERQQKYIELTKELGEESEKQVRDILLPMQIQRLKQILLQTKMQQMQWGGANAFIVDELAEELEISDEQKAKFAEKEKELRAEIQKKTQEFYKKLQEETRAELLDVLTEEQRAKLQRLTGPTFEWKYEAPAAQVTKPVQSPK